MLHYMPVSFPPSRYTISIYSRWGIFPLIWNENQEFSLPKCQLLPMKKYLNTNQDCNYKTPIFGLFLTVLICYSFSLLPNVTSSIVLSCSKLFCGNLFHIQERNAKHSLCCLHHVNTSSNLYSKLSLAVCLAIIWDSQM